MGKVLLLTQVSFVTSNIFFINGFILTKNSLETRGVYSVEISSSILSDYLILLVTNNNGREHGPPSNGGAVGIIPGW